MYSIYTETPYTHIQHDGDDVYGYQDNKTYRLKQCKGYAAVYPLYQKEENDKWGGYHPSNPKDFYCDFFIDGQYAYTLRRNDYYPPEEFLVEFFTRDSDGKIVFIFNKKHGEISVCDPENGKTLHTEKNNDVFITSYTVLRGGKYMYFEGWYWSPYFFSAIYDIQKLIADGEDQCYSPVHIQYEEENSPDYEVTDDGMLRSKLLDRIYAPEYVMEHHDYIAQECEDKYIVLLYNKNRNGNILLKHIFDGSFDENVAIITYKDLGAMAHLEQLLSNDVATLHIKVICKNSGEDLSSSYCFKLISAIEEYCKSDVFNHMLIKKFFDGNDKALYTPAVTLRFEFSFTLHGDDTETIRRFYLDVDQTLIHDPAFPGYDRYTFDDDVPTQIVIGFVSI